MRSYFKISLYALLGVVGLQACAPSQPSAKSAAAKPLLTVGSLPVSREEFVYLYEKNHQNPKAKGTEADVRAYLNLYVQFKRKVAEAHALGYAQRPAYQQEVEGYRQQLAQPYLTDQQQAEQLLQQTYERLGQEVRASHLLLTLPEFSQDTAAVYAQLMALRARLQQGEPFGALARAYSQDPSARYNGGDLGYFTALQMVGPFEEAAFHTPVGQVSMPVRTRFGYHLLQVSDRRKARGQVRVAHIMLKTPEGLDERTTELRAEELYARLQAGASWDTLCRQYSEDVATFERGGELPWLNTNSQPEEIAQAAYRLREVGQVSEPVATRYGWHILRLLERKTLPPLADMRAELLQRMARDGRSELPRQQLLARFKQEQGFAERADLRPHLLAAFDSTLLQGKWAPSEKVLRALGGKTLFTLGGKAEKVAGFLAYARAQQQPYPDWPLERYVDRLLTQYTEQTLMARLRAQLPAKHPEYRLLCKEYEEGLLLFSVMEEQVWNRASQNSAGLEAFYRAHPERYSAQVWEQERGRVMADYQQQLEDDWMRGLERKYPLWVDEQQLRTLWQPLQ